MRRLRFGSVSLVSVSGGSGRIVADRDVAPAGQTAPGNSGGAETRKSGSVFRSRNYQPPTRLVYIHQKQAGKWRGNSRFWFGCGPGGFLVYLNVVCLSYCWMVECSREAQVNVIFKETGDVSWPDLITTVVLLMQNFPCCFH